MNPLRAHIYKLVEEYYNEGEIPPFIPGTTPIPASGKVYTSDELKMGVEAVLDGWWTSGKHAKEFENEFASKLGVKHVSLCNSGSSANLLAVSALTSPRFENPLRPGDKVLTVAAGFPTTINAILQNQLVPVFVDIELATYNADIEQICKAFDNHNIRAVILAHTLGNPFDLAFIDDLDKDRGKEPYLVEDTCDALGSLYYGSPVGTYGDLATFSFYPAHHITMGEGGAVATNSSMLNKVVESFRDWGRSCWCDPGKDNTCGKRFSYQLGQLPCGYDHKYTYDHIGYNLKLTDMQAAIGRAQLKKLPDFIDARRRNFKYLYDELFKEGLEEFFIFPHSIPGADPCWFGFPLTVKETAPFSRGDIIQFLEKRKIGTRHLFGGNMTKQPAYKNIVPSVNLPNTDIAMERTFWIGIWPGLTKDMLSYVVKSFCDFIKKV